MEGGREADKAQDHIFDHEKLRVGAKLRLHNFCEIKFIK